MDLFLLNRLEKFAHRFQKLTGKTNFFLAVVCIYIGLGILLLSIFWIKEQADMIFTTVLNIGLAFIWGTNHIVNWKNFENAAYQRLKNGLANPLKNNLMYRCFRMIVTCFGMFVFVCFYSAPTHPDMHVSSPYMFFLSLALWLESCDPLPPCRGKIGEIIDAFFAPKLVPIPIKESDK